MVHIFKNLNKEKQQKFVLSSILKPEVQNQGVSRVMLPPEAPGSICPLPTPSFPALAAQHPLAPVSVPVFMAAFHSVSSVPLPASCKDTQSLDLRLVLNPGWFPLKGLTNYMFITLFPNKGIFWPLGRHNFFFFFSRGKGDTIRPTTQDVEGSSAFFPRPFSECPAFCLSASSFSTDRQLTMSLVVTTKSSCTSVSQSVKWDQQCLSGSCHEV